MLAYSLTLNTPTNQQFVADYRRVYGQFPTQQAAHGYMCMMWIKQAIDGLKGDVSDKTKLLAALRSVELKDSPKGPARLDSYGGVVENMYVRRVDSVKGHFQNTQSSIGIKKRNWAQLCCLTTAQVGATFC